MHALMYYNDSLVETEPSFPGIGTKNARTTPTRAASYLKTAAETEYDVTPAGLSTGAPPVEGPPEAAPLAEMDHSVDQRGGALVASVRRDDRGGGGRGGQGGRGRYKSVNTHNCMPGVNATMICGCDYINTGEE